MLLLKIYIYSVCKGVWSASMYMHLVHAVPPETKRGCQIPWGWSYHGCDPPCVTWQWNLGFLQEQQMHWAISPATYFSIFLLCLFIWICMYVCMWGHVCAHGGQRTICKRWFFAFQHLALGDQAQDIRFGGSDLTFWDIPWSSLYLF